jgi:RNA polymerase sigma-70 factor (ECF subfamily)
VVNDAAARVYDRLLILRCQTGDPAALREVIGRYSPGLRLFIAKIGAADCCDDVLQETWFDVYRKLKSLQQPDAFAAWVYRIARDKVYRLRRRRLPAFVDHDVAQLPADVDEDFSQEESARVRIALDALAVEHREVLLLRFVESMSYEQIAEVINRPNGTVRSRIHYAKLALRAQLERYQTRSES